MNRLISSTVKILVSCSMLVSSIGWSNSQSFKTYSPAEAQNILAQARTQMLKAEENITGSVHFLDSNLSTVSLSDLSKSPTKQVIVREAKTGLMIRFTPKVTSAGRNIMILESLNHNGKPERMTTIAVDNLKSMAEVKVSFENAFAVLTGKKVGQKTETAKRTIATDFWSVEKACVVPVGSSYAKETTEFGPGFTFIALGIMAAIIFGPAIKIPASAAKPVVYISIALMVGVPLFMMITEKKC